MTSAKATRVLRFAAFLAIFSLVLMLWSIFDSRVIPLMIFMTVGQVLGTISLLLYLAVLALDTRRRLGDSGRTLLDSINPEGPAPEDES